MPRLVLRMLVGVSLLALAACSARPSAFPTRDAAAFRDEWTPENWREEVSPFLARGVLGDSHEGHTGTSIAKANTLRATYYANVERATGASGSIGSIGSQADNLPKFCVALSGGGIRAGAVSMGVLKGLHTNGYLAKTSYLSSTSGGSYAAAWLYAVSAVEGHGVESIFSNNADASKFAVARYDERTGKAMRHDERNFREKVLAQIMRNAYYNKVVAQSEFVGNIATEGLLTSPLLLARALYQRYIAPSNELTPGGIGIMYSKAIRSTFLRDKKVSLGQVARAQVKHALPYPIFLGSMAVGQRRPCGSPSFGNTLNDAVEVTPHRLGSSHYGFTDGHKQLHLDELVTGVGAAPDNPSFDLLCRITDALGMDVGLRVTGLTMVPSRIIPATITVETSSRWGREQERSRVSDLVADGVHISDGGFVENLAVLPLIERMCERIVIVDAEHDPKLEFGSYRKLKELLERERGILFTVPAIDQHLLFKAGSEDRSMIVYRDARDTPFSADLLVRNGLPGQISGIALFDAERDAVRPVTLEVTYLKLGLDRARILDHGFFAQIKYGEDFHDVRFFDKAGDLRCSAGNAFVQRCPFPQESTFRQSFRFYEFLAYVLLGEHLTRLLPR